MFGFFKKSRPSHQLDVKKETVKVVEKGEERFVPSEALQRQLDEDLARNGPKIREGLRACRERRSQSWCRKMLKEKLKGL